MTAVNLGLASKLPQVGIGTDICYIPRIYNLLAGDRAEQFINRILTPPELSSARATKILERVRDKRGPRPFSPYRPTLMGHSKGVNPLMRAAQYMAGRFAAKEAVAKAYSVRKIYFDDIVIAYEYEIADFKGSYWLRKSWGEPFSRTPSGKEEEEEKEEEEKGEEGEEGEGGEEEETKPSEEDFSAGKDAEGEERGRSGPPIAIIRGGREYEDMYARISISHDGEYATASCLAALENPKPRLG